MKGRFDDFSLENTVLVLQEGKPVRILNRFAVQLAQETYRRLDVANKPDFGSYVRMIESDLNSRNPE